jgi:hypothetical protein
MLILLSSWLGLNSEKLLETEDYEAESYLPNNFYFIWLLINGEFKKEDAISSKLTNFLSVNCYYYPLPKWVEWQG